MSTTYIWPIKGSKQLEYILDSCGFNMSDIMPDGNCFFRSIARGVYNNEEMYDTIRKTLIKYISLNSDYYTHFIPDLNSLIKETCKDRSWNTDLADIFPIAFTKMTGIPIVVYEWQYIDDDDYDLITNKEMSTFALSDNVSEAIKLILFDKAHYNLIE